MSSLQKILSAFPWKLKLELPEQILERLYEHRRLAEYVTLTDAFENITFEALYEKVAMLQQSRLIDFYTAPEAYAVFNEPDFIRAKIRAEGIRYWEDHGSFLRKHKAPVRIAAAGLALIICTYVVSLFFSDRQIISGNNTGQPVQQVSLSDTVAAKSDVSTPVQLPAHENQVQPKKTGKDEGKRLPKDTARVRRPEEKDAHAEGIEKGKQNAAVDVKRNYIINLDTLNHLVKVSPRVGTWDSTVLAIPMNEMEQVQPEFKRESETVGADFTFDALGTRFSGIMATTSPASESVFYTLHYVNKPTLFLFGSYPDRLYPYYFNQKIDGR